MCCISNVDYFRNEIFFSELLLGAMPFNILKMFVPLSVLLGLTPIYARPALPLPTRAVSNFNFVFSMWRIRSLIGCLKVYLVD